MLRRIAAVKKNEKGATAIEFALVAPALFLLIFGIIEFGIIMSTQSALEGSASYAARTYKALARTGNPGADTSIIHNLIARRCSGLVNPAKLRVVATRIAGWGGAGMPANATNSSGNGGTTGEIIQYRVYYDYQIFTPFLSNILAPGKQGKMLLRASTVVQNEPDIG